MNLHLVFRFVLYFFKAKNEHSIQAPFLFNFYINIVKRRGYQPHFEQIENERTLLLLDKGKVETINLGAGSKAYLKQNSIKNIAKASLSSPKKCALLYNIASTLNCMHMVEMGTSFGICTAYLAKANKNAKIISFEGDKTLSTKASKINERLGNQNILFANEDFDTALPAYLKTIDQKIDFVFIDGNHRLKPTLKYFELILPHINENSVLVIDDIYWSAEMTKVWKIISNHPSVTISVDLFEIGIVFFNTKYSKEHFVLKF